MLIKRKGCMDYFILLIVIIIGGMFIFGLLEYKDYKNNPYYKLDRQSIDFNGIRYKINRNSELEIYKEHVTRTHSYNVILKIPITHTHYSYTLIKKISFDITEEK